MEELKEFLDELEERMEKVDRGTTSDNKKDIERAKKEIKEKLDNYEHEALIFATPNGSLVTGSILNVTATISTMLHQVRNDIPTELLTEAFIRALATDEDIDDLDRKVIKKILKAIEAILKEND